MLRVEFPPGRYTFHLGKVVPVDTCLDHSPLSDRKLRPRIVFSGPDRVNRKSGKPQCFTVCVTKYKIRYDPL